MTSVLHAVVAGCGWWLLGRGLTTTGSEWRAPDPSTAESFALAVLVASAAGSLATLAAGRGLWRPRVAMVADLASLTGAFIAFGILSLGPWSHDLGGVFLVLIVAVRLAPGALAVLTAGGPAALAFLTALAVYAAVSIWATAASALPRAEVGALMVAEQLRAARIDSAMDPDLFRSLVGLSPGPADAFSQIAQTPLGPRAVQGYAFPLLLLPGWAVGGRLGAHIVPVLAAAWTSLQILLILRDLFGRRRAVGWTWLLASFLAPLPILAAHLHPGIVGAAIAATAYRAGFTAPTPRPVLAGALLGLTLFLAPGDGVAFMVLAPFLLGRLRAAERVRTAVAMGGIALLALIVNGMLYALPIPYAGQVLATNAGAQSGAEAVGAQAVWLRLPEMLFDGSNGLAGTAPWVFIGLFGLAPALRTHRGLLPAVVAVGAGLAAAALLGPRGQAEALPGWYLAGTLALWPPLVAMGLELTVSVAARITAGIVAGMSALATLLITAMPSLALASEDQRLREIFEITLGIDPLGWLPAFGGLSPAAPAYIGSLVALTIAVGSFLIGARRGSVQGTAVAPGPAGSLRGRR